MLFSELWYSRNEPYATLQSVDMTAEQSSEAVEIVTMAVDKYTATSNYEVSHARVFLTSALCRV